MLLRLLHGQYLAAKMVSIKKISFLYITGFCAESDLHLGLRLFTEAKDGGSEGKYWDDHPAIMAVGVVDANSEAVFQTVMSLGQSRSE
jgi:hypothetical protein